MHRSPYFGQSVEFLQHREYAAGDDLRRVDWKVWAKQDRLYVKQYEEDTNLRCCMLVDVSASMEYGSGPMTKYDYAVTSAAALAYLLLRQQDAVGCAVFDEAIRQVIPLRTSTSHLTTIVRALERREPRDKTGIYEVLTRAAETYPRRGMMVLISDLLVDPSDVQRGLRLLRQLGHDVLVLHLLDDDELDFPFARPSRFEGLETDDHVTCNPRALRDGYLAALNHYLETIRHNCARDNVDYQLIRTSTPLDAALTAFLTHRGRERPNNR
jgi:uncharacterized protein (DUF58 family)